MNGDPLSRVSPGDAIPHSAETWNAILEAARQFRGGGVGRLGGARVDYDQMTPALTIDVRNDTGSTLLQWGVLKLSTPLILPDSFPLDAQDAPAFIGITPTASADIVAIAHHGAATGETVRATVAGVAVCKINVTNAAHTFASPTTSATYLLSGTSGLYPILWKETGTGSKMAIVLMGSGSSSTSGVSTTETIVTNVACSGSTLIVTTKSFTWTNGVLTAVV